MGILWSQPKDNTKTLKSVEDKLEKYSNISVREVVEKFTCFKCNEEIDKEIMSFDFLHCKHKICAKCLCLYLDSFTSARILCPFPKCSKLIPDKIVRECLSNIQLEKYDGYCYPSTKVKCLISDCPYFVLPSSSDCHFICEICKQPNCVTCLNLHYENEPCGVSPNKRMFEEDASVNLRMYSRQNLITLAKESASTLNPEKSECNLCYKFLIPRQGYLTIPCFHNHCRECLKGYASNAENILQLCCPSCNTLLPNSQCRDLIGDEKLDTICHKEIINKHYHCLTPDCPVFWDKGDCTTSYKCPKCLTENCIPCEAIHENMSCSQYKNSIKCKKLLRDTDNIKLKLQKQKLSVKCYNCQKELIQFGGCGSLNCDNCGHNVCVFTGKSLGVGGCNCTSSKPCNKDCKHGCIPD